MKKTKMLKKNYEFRYILTKGKYYSGKYLQAFIKKNDKSINLLGIAVSSKAGKAVQRNYLKRLIRENYKNIERKLKVGYSIVILLKKNQKIEDINYDKVKIDIAQIVEKAGVIED